MASMADLGGAQESLRRGYREYLGRDPSDEELRGQLGNYRPGQYEPRNVQYSLGQLQNSPEARAYAERQRTTATPPTTPTTPGAGWTNPATSTGADTSMNAPRIVTEGGQTYLTEHGNRRALQGDEIASAQSYVDDFWRQFPTGFQPGIGGQTNADYQPGGRYPNWLMNAPPAGSRFTPGGYSYTGFNFERDQNVGKSAKDAFAYATSLGERAGAGTMWHTKQGAQQFAELYIKPYLEQQGYKVLGINGDQINIVTREDEQAGNTAGSWFDFVVNADGGSMGLTPQLAWQIQSGTGAQGAPPPTTGTGYTPTTLPAATPPPTAGGAPAAGQSPLPGISQEAYDLLVQRGVINPYDPNNPATLADLISPRTVPTDRQRPMYAAQGPPVGV